MHRFYRISLQIIFFYIFISDLFATELSEKENFVRKNLTKKQISLNFQNIKLSSALNLLAEFSGFNFIMDDKIKGSLSIYLQDVSWEQALDIIADPRFS